jgi:hypothetical protein
MKKNTTVLVFASKESGLGVNVDETKYMVSSRDQNAGRNHNMYKISPLKGWNNPGIWEQPQKITIPFMKKLIAD